MNNHASTTRMAQEDSTYQKMRVWPLLAWFLISVLGWTLSKSTLSVWNNQIAIAQVGPVKLAMILELAALAAMGWFQYPIIQRYFPGLGNEWRKWWTVVFPAGVVLGKLFFGLVYPILYDLMITRIPNLFIASTLGSDDFWVGLSIGMGIWYILKRETRLAWLWPIATCAALLLSRFTGYFLPLIMNFFVFASLLGCLYGVIYGLLTAGVLWWLVRKSPAKGENVDKVPTASVLKTFPPSYRPNTIRTNWVIGFYAVSMVSAYLLSFRSPGFHGNLFIILFIVKVMILLGALIAFCFWLYRASQNLHALGVPELRFSPRMAVGWFFIPLMNLFRPYQVMVELWKASSATADTDWRKQPVPALVGWWWVLLTLGNLNYWVFSRIQGMDLDFMAAQLDLLCFVSYGLLILIVYIINQRQDLKASRLLAGSQEKLSSEGMLETAS